MSESSIQVVARELSCVTNRRLAVGSPSGSRKTPKIQPLHHKRKDICLQLRGMEVLSLHTCSHGTHL
ncbi:hypothetical protein BDA96_08G182400 [Sorghum bicolor]|uniref:Uncharacterized protein n=1 Tax=Sorghum bicolor TaxID=4558 RepID=A0A921QGX6_SORBI|nr:hypothetical protein BDA96_08G182400 [Sorghum bicolor]